MGEKVELRAADGHRLAAYVARPKGTPRGAVVVVQEIFGVNRHIRAVTDGFAADGYLAVAPALFDRIQRDYETGYEPEDIAAGRALKDGTRLDDSVRDVSAAVEFARAGGEVAVVGYCWGGTVAWLAATRIDGIACAVPYYGGGIPEYAAEAPRCPVLCHFGDKDTSPAPDAARAAVAKHKSVTAHFYPAGHGFNCDLRGSYHEESAKLARERTIAFLAKKIGS
ncbi:MAG: dienelactone hydrolase family protein [Burkholderiaceae bacterium]|nr:dienelactone hydrolase family protein [Burkholderiaceae bacterium]